MPNIDARGGRLSQMLWKVGLLHDNPTFKGFHGIAKRVCGYEFADWVGDGLCMSTQG